MGLFRNKQAKPDTIIDLTHTAPAIDDEPKVAKPGACPKCAGPGYLDHIDLVTRVQRQHCRACGSVWEISIANDQESSFFEMESNGIEIPSS